MGPTGARYYGEEIRDASGNIIPPGKNFKKNPNGTFTVENSDSDDDVNNPYKQKTKVVAKPGPKDGKSPDGKGGRNGRKGGKAVSRA